MEEAGLSEDIILALSLPGVERARHLGPDEAAEAKALRQMHLTCVKG